MGIFNSFKTRVAGKKAGPDQALAYQLRLALLAAGYRAGLVPDPAFGAHASPLQSEEEATPPEHTGSSSQGWHLPEWPSGCWVLSGSSRVWLTLVCLCARLSAWSTASLLPQTLTSVFSGRHSTPCPAWALSYVHYGWT